MGISFRCQDYRLAREAVKKRLEHISFQRGLPFSVSTKMWYLNAGKVTEAEAASEELRKGLPYEASLIHNAFSVARMSLQDRNYIRSIVESLGENAHVLHGDRILVLYEADLLSTESVQLLQNLLEMRSESGNITVWMTVRESVPLKLQDWFLDLPIATDFPMYHPWAGVIWEWVENTRALKVKDIRHVKSLRDALYALLQRNIRWFDFHQILLELVMEHESELGPKLVEDILDCLARSPNTGAGNTLTSYRIPIAWENLFVGLYDILVGTKTG